ncbi:hypothetical protein PHBOTO_003479 [Pseudozyma hubeiensis]|nr:hypothetical protein PHBOTO_003479 [Pseudozyma hubeiensis]
MSYSKQEPQYLRLLPYVFPEQPWLKRAKMQVWERPSVQQHVASQAFDDQLTWVNLEDLPRMRRILRKRSPAVRPSRILPSVSVSPAEPVKEIVERVPHNVYLTDHGYRGRYRDGKVAGTPLESKPYYGFWALPKNPAEDNFMYFLGMGYLDLAPKTSPVQVLPRDASRSEREGTSL